MLHKPISHKSKAWLLYMCLLMLMAGCTKCNKTVMPAQSELSKLPPATQTGAGTFGCMLNGQAWLPSGRHPLFTPITNLDYDRTFRGGTLSIDSGIFADKPTNGSTPQQAFLMGLVGVGAIGEYNLANSSSIRFFYDDSASGMQYASDKDIASNCKLVITKLDTDKQIIAGTFSFTLEKRETGKKITVTDGRFDLKYL